MLRFNDAITSSVYPWVITNLVSKYKILCFVLRFQSLGLPSLVKSLNIGIESRHIYERDAIGPYSFPSSLFSCGTIKLNSIRSLFCVFLFDGLLDVIAWTRWYFKLEGENANFFMLSMFYG